jgi:glycosyltransferase involved in cell wall biosynthesis
MALRAPWLVIREGERRRWGGDLRRHYLLDGLVTGRRAGVVEDWSPRQIELGLADLLAVQRRTRLRPRRLWVRRPLVASSELLNDDQLGAVLRLGVATALDYHDEPLLQAEALGITLPADERARLSARLERNVAAFRWITAPSAPFARLAGLPSERVVVAGNGTDSAAVRPVPLPATPAVAFISGAAPSRGIEELIEAVRLVRDDVPDTRLLLFLAATGEGSAAYLEALQASHAEDPWIEFGTARYDALGEALGRATLLAIPTPSHPYWDSVPPIKLFDGMAAGRPHVVTPRAETARIVEANDAGVVAAGDDAASLATAMAGLLRAPATVERMGNSARRAAENEYDWRTIGARLAAELDRLSSPWARLAPRHPRSA